MSIQTDDKDLYIVWVFDEVDALSNALLALINFKRHVPGGFWPSKIALHKLNRITFGFGDDVKMERRGWNLLDAAYVSTYKPIEDRPDGRAATMFKRERKPIAGELRRRRSKMR